MKITMPRGDIRIIPFTVRDSTGTLSTIQFDEIYFTVKRKFTDADYAFQKKLSDGDISTDGQGSFWIRIDPADTNNLKFGKYVYDIEFVEDANDIKQTGAYDEFVLLPESTWASNETSVT